jgi:septum formation protein
VKTIVLASASPRRSELLQRLGLNFIVDASEYRESDHAGLEPRELVRRISSEKARKVATRHKDAVVIAADTLGVVGTRVIGKPNTPFEAVNMLKDISGKSHLVITGLTVVDTDTGKIVTRIVETKVYFRDLSAEEIHAYVDTGEPLDKAGAYAIQGLGALLVEKIEGDYYNVVGLPLCTLAVVLREFGIRVL